MEIFKKPGRDWTEKCIKAAYSYFTKNYLDELISFAYGYIQIGVSNKERAYELAKDVVANKLADAFHRYLHTYDPEKYKGKKCPFRNFIFTIVAREATKVSKKEGKVIIIPEDEIGNIPNPISPKAWAEIEPYVDMLSPKYKEVLELTQREQLSHREAVKQTRWPCKEGAIKLRLFRAKQELVQLVEKEHLIDRLPTELRQAYNLIEVRGNLSGKAALIADCTEDEMKRRLDQAKAELVYILMEKREKSLHSSCTKEELIAMKKNLFAEAARIFDWKEEELKELYMQGHRVKESGKKINRERREK